MRVHSWSPPIRFEIARRLVGAALALTVCAAAQLVTLTAAPQSSDAPDANPLTLRSPDHDAVWLRKGDPLTGRVLNRTFTLRTAYGSVAFETRQVAALRLAAGAHRIDTLYTLNSNRFSGYLEDPTLSVQPTHGPALQFPREQIQIIALRTAAPPSPLPRADGSSALFLVANGDVFTGLLEGGPFRLSTPYADLPLALEHATSIAFEDTYPLLARVRMRDGTTLEGGWPEQHLRIRLDTGGRLSLYPNQLRAIDFLTPAPAEDELPSGSAPRPTAPQTLALPGMVWIPPGQFLMGSPVDEPDRDLDEGPVTEVTLTHGFWMAAHEVTQGEYQAVMGENPSLFLGDPRRPVEKVRWRDAVDYCERLTRRQLADGALPPGYAYRLPTEAEWEYACRAGTSTRFSFGDDPAGHALESYAWFSANSNSSTHPVGTRQPNPWGLHDLHGNVLEWCLDGATDALPGGQTTDYQAPIQDLLRMARGGSWLYTAKACRSANRDTYSETSRSSDLGFRVVIAKIPEPITTTP